MENHRCRHVAARFVGSFFLLIGIAANRYVLGLLSSDGQITSVLLNSVIVLVEVACMSLGVWLITKKPPGSINWAVGLGATLFTLTAIEILSVTVGVFVPKDFAERNKVFYHFFQPDSALGFRIKANLDKYEITWMNGSVSARYDIDEYGFRNKNRDYSKTRLWFVGDSFTYGEWIERDKTFYGLIETRLNRPVISLGVPAYGFMQYWLLIDRFLNAYQPELVAVCIFANDLMHPLTKSELEDYYRLEGWDKYESFPFYKRLFSYNLIKESLRFVAGLSSVPSDEQGAPREIGQGEAGNGLTLFRYRGASRFYVSDSLFVNAENVLVRIIEKCQLRNTKPILFLFPSKESTYKDDYRRLFPGDYLRNEEEGYKRICTLAEKKGIPCIDLTPRFRHDGGQKTLYSEKDPHWNELGHRVAADEMLKYIENELSGFNPTSDRE